MATDLFYGLLPEHILLALLLLLMLIEITGSGKRASGFLFVLAAGAGCVVLMLQLTQRYAAEIVPGEVSVDHFALAARLVLFVCAVVYGISNLSDSRSPKFWMLITSSIIGGSILMVSSSFVPLFLGIELLSLPAFALMVHRTGLTDAAEGAIKYLLLSAVASAMILFGISLAYGTTGTLLLVDFTATFASGGLLSLAASILVLCGFFLKAAVFPFHGWAPDAYSGAKLQVTTFLAAIVKAAVVLGLVRVFGLTPLNNNLTGVVVVLGVVSILYGNITAIRQRSFKRMLAYSSIAHAGYMIFALADNTGGRTDVLLYYLAVYALTTIVACASFAMLVPEGSDDLEHLDGRFADRPLPTVILALAVLSLAGIPPLPGFVAKFFVFTTVIASGHLVPAVLAFVGSFVGVIYYLGIVGRLFSSTPSQERPAPVGWTLGGVLLGVLILTLFAVIPGNMIL